ncbi:B12-binding domain-containing radical SAM protein [Alkaliphilus transvaalensis]|uniref:B12-binding domain-containing radical SAM protein n=1 Tax=Alkaliphilus transvaalensis TaxID=114628 RepID=UPI000478F86A|nr:B12-binding domain-containing radical SAM protein [Alkaliphilus transvaalensis]
MKVLLVRTARIKQAITLGEFMYSEPLGLEMVYTLLEKDHQVEIFDMMSEETNIEEKLKEFQPQVVGITSLCIDVLAVNALAKDVKKYDPSIITLVGGTQAYFNHEAFFIDEIDHIMKFTTSKNMIELFEYLEKGEDPTIIDGIYSRVNDYQTTNVCGRNEYIRPNRESTAKYRHQYSYFGYRPAAIIGTAQGCSKTCGFCLRWRMEGHKEHYFPMEFVKEEIKNIKEETIMIIDNDFLHNGERLEELCNFLEGENIRKRFICYASVDSIINNRKEIKRFKELGLSAVLVGYETFKEEELKKYQKKSSVEDNFEASRFLKEIKLDVWASFMLHPDWSKEDFKSFRKYLTKLDPEISTFSPLTPFPNLPLYGAYKERLLVEKENYEQWSFGQVTIRPSKMSLRRYYYEILKTHLYINLFGNDLIYMVKRFGLSTILRLSKGSIKLMIRYLKLMKEK